ncbi:hypothetical protein J132_04806 [Termitomyces sp. J132]|nr:hypothetical protein C0989_002617 [Termitomyces sp. Mn162]KNZ80564.1 hypothetical protein J132_04806 [Termitomyces sp. J132]
MPVASTKQPWIVTSKEGEKEAEDVEMRETTSLAMVAEVKLAASDIKVESKEEFEAGVVDIDEDENEGEEEAKVQ